MIGTVDPSDLAEAAVTRRHVTPLTRREVSPPRRALTVGAPAADGQGQDPLAAQLLSRESL